MLGVRLLDRSRRGVEPTHYGRAIIKRGVAVFDEIRQGVKDIEFLTDPTAGELRIGCTDGAAAGPGLAVIDHLASRYPRIVFNIVTGGDSQLYRRVAERNVELAIAGIAGPIPDAFAVEKLFDDALVVAAGVQNPWTRRRRVELAELMNEAWALPPADSNPGAILMEAFRTSGLQLPQRTIVAGSRFFRERLMITGRYLSVSAGYSVTPPGHNPLIKALAVNLPGARRPIVLITLRNRTLSPLAELFIKTAREIVVKRK
jgi:DNA-binding transcriptional LysR family regulator